MPPWLLFALAPMVIAAASVLLGRLSQAAWLAIIARIAFAEAIFMASAFAAGPYPWEFRYVAATLSATVLVPWVGVVLYLRFTRSSRRKIMKALGLPVVYFILLGFGLVIGDASGMIPQ